MRKLVTTRSRLRISSGPVGPGHRQDTVGARQLVRQDGGRAANFRVRNRCNYPDAPPTGERLQKAVAWHSDWRSRERQGIPREFTTKSRVVIISNDWKLQT